jgi:hypothetical protein
LAYSRRELTRTLRVHELVTMATLAVCWGISTIFTIGLIVGVMELVKHDERGGGPGLSILTMVGLCAAGWLPCCHYLWRCYKSGLRDVRRLHRQIYRLDFLDAKFRRAPVSRRRRGAGPAIARARGKPSGSPQLFSPAETAGFSNVVPFERSRH